MCVIVNSPLVSMPQIDISVLHTNKPNITLIENLQTFNAYTNWPPKIYSFLIELCLTHKESEVRKQSFFSNREYDIYVKNGDFAVAAELCMRRYRLILWRMRGYSFRGWKL